MEFTYNRFSGESWESQRKKHFQNVEYVNAITTSIGQSNRINIELAKLQTKEAKQNFDQLNGSIDNFAKSISNNLEEGFFRLNESIVQNNESLDEITDKLNILTNITFLGFQRLTEEIKITNCILGKIEQLIRVPDSQKQRYHLIEEGVKFLKIGFAEGQVSKYYDYAYDEFSKSLNQIDNKDYFSLYYLGYLHLNIEKYDDLEKAELYSSNAGDFFKAEGFISGTSNARAMNGDNFSYNQRAIESYQNAARSCYQRQLFEKAIDYCDKCININNRDLTSLYLKAKYLVMLNRSLESVKLIEEILKINKYCLPKILLDLDLSQDKEIQEYSYKLSKHTFNLAKSSFLETTGFKTQNYQANNILKVVEEYILKEDYISSCKAIDLLNKINEYSFYNSPYKMPNNKWSQDIKTYQIYLNIFGFIKYEPNVIIVKDKINKINEIKVKKDVLLKDIEVKINSIKTNELLGTFSEIKFYGLQALVFSSMILVILYVFFRITLLLPGVYDNPEKQFYEYGLFQLLISGIVLGLFLLGIGYLIELNNRENIKQIKANANNKLDYLETQISKLINEIDNIKN